MPHVLVLGGTGFVGRHLCEKLQRHGWHITVPTRRAVHAAAIRHLPRLTVVEASVHEDTALDGLLHGMDAVVNLVAILHGDEAAFERTHVELPTRLVAACARAGVKQAVHVSALGADPQGPSRYLRSKGRGEAVWQGAAGAGSSAADRLGVHLLRPSVIFGADDRFLNLFARLQSVFPVMPLAGAKARFQPVWVEDVADALVACLARPLPPGQARVFECAGPQVFTLAELVRLAGRWSGHERPVLPLPEALGRLQAWTLEHLPGEPMMSRDNLDSMRQDNVASGHVPGLEALGIKPTGLEAVGPIYLDRRARRATQRM